MLAVATFIDVCANIGYYLAGGKYVLLIARFFAGAGAGNSAVISNYITAHTQASERARYMSLLSIAISLAYVLGPGI